MIIWIHGFVYVSVYVNVHTYLYIHGAPVPGSHTQFDRSDVEEYCGGAMLRVFSMQYSEFNIQYAVFSMQGWVFSIQYSVFCILYSVFSMQYSELSIHYPASGIPYSVFSNQYAVLHDRCLDTTLVIVLCNLVFTNPFN